MLVYTLNAPKHVKRGDGERATAASRLHKYSVAG